MSSQPWNSSGLGSTKISRSRNGSQSHPRAGHAAKRLPISDPVVNRVTIETDYIVDNADPHPTPARDADMHGSRRSDQIGLPTVAEIEMPLTRRESAARKAREQEERRVVSVTTGEDRDALAAEFRHKRKLAGVPPGSIIRPVGPQ
jgi:hypothetical protein